MANLIKLSNGKLTIEALEVTAPQVVLAAKAAEADGRDLAEYVTSAIEIGVTALQASSVSIGVEVLAENIDKASANFEKSSGDFQKNIKADLAKILGPEGSFPETLTQRLEEFTESLEELTAGDDSPIGKALQAKLAETARTLKEDFSIATRNQSAHIAKLFDPENAESPLRFIKTEFEAVTSAVREVKQEVAINAKLVEMKAITPIGGREYEDDAIAAVQEVTAWAGDECEATGKLTGAIPRNKMGDGVIDLRAGATVVSRIVVECKDGLNTKNQWLKEMEGAKANRRAKGFIGLCKNVDDMPGRARLVFLDSQSVLLAFDPAQDDVQMLHLIYQMVKMNTMRSAGALDQLDMATVSASLDDSLKAIDDFTEVLKQVKAIENSAKYIRDGIGKSSKRIAENVGIIQEAISASLTVPLAVDAEVHPYDIFELETSDDDTEGDD